MNDSLQGIVHLSGEKKFIYHDSYNKGSTQLPNVISCCIGLSNNAKVVYSFICRHVLERGHTSFPSIYKIACACNCSLKSVINYLDELVEHGLIVKKNKGIGQGSEYYLVDCHEVPLLKVSELFWTIMNDLQKTYSWKQILSAKNKILKQIKDEGYKVSQLTIDENSQDELKNDFIRVIEGGKPKMGLLPKNKRFIKGMQDVPQSDQVFKSSSPTAEKESKNKKLDLKRKVPIGINKNHYKLLPVDQWRIAQFKEYFYDKYLDATDMPHPRNESKHKGMMKRVLENLGGDNHALKKYIDTFFEMGYDNQTLEFFSTSRRLGEIQTYLTRGKKPFFLENKDPRKSNVPKDTKYKGMSKDKLNQLLGGDV